MDPQRAECPATSVREPPVVAGDVSRATVGSIGNRNVGRLLRAGHGAALQRALMGAGAPPPVGRRTLARFELLQEAPTGGSAPGEAPVKLLRRGSAGSLVAELQGDLNAIAVEPALVADGQFGGQTDLAVRFFQQAHRLVVDGIVGRETRSMLDREIALHGGAEARLARGGGPCHTPDAPGPDELAQAPPAPVPPAPSARASGLLGFRQDAGGGGGGQPAPPPGQKAAPGDLVVRLGDSQLEKDLAEAAAAPGTTSELVKTRQELIDLVKKRGNVGKLIIISHGTQSGAVKFADEKDPTKLADLAKDLQGAGSASEVAFRGCNVGNDATGLNEVKKAVNASSAEGTNCFLQVAHAGPIPINGAVIDTEAKFKAIKSNNKKQPDSVLKAQYHAALRKATRGHGDCIVELKPNQTMAGLTDDELRALAMRHNGRLIMQYYEDHDTGKFTCWKDLQFGGSGPCKRVQAR